MQDQHDDDCNSQFDCLFGEVVWAKCSIYPWWPCYVFDPSEFCLKQNVGKGLKTRARSSMRNKEYIVYFYGDEEKFAFTKAKNIKPFSHENVVRDVGAHHSYIETLMKGIELAEIEVRLPKEKRLKWSRCSEYKPQSFKTDKPIQSTLIKNKKIKMNECRSFFLNPILTSVDVLKPPVLISRQQYLAETAKMNEAPSIGKRTRPAFHNCSYNCFKDDNHSCCQYWCGVACNWSEEKILCSTVAN